MRITLLILLSFVALSAFVSGLLMMNYPDGIILGVPRYMIEASPFRNLVVPGIILAFGVGGIHFMALYHYMDKSKTLYNWSAAAGVTTCGWVAVQFALVHTIMGLQAFYLLAGPATVLLSLQLKTKWIV